MARSADPTLAERRRRQILDAAIVCFGRRGFHRTSMQEICGEAALSAGALYRYFPSKSDIIAAIAEEDRRDSEPLFAAIAAGEMIDGICALAAHMVAKCTAKASLFAEVIAETLRDRELSERFAAHEAGTRARLVAAIAAAWRRAPGADMTPERAARLVMLMLDGLAMRVMREGVHGAVDTGPLLDDFRQALVRLFATTAPPPRKRALAGVEP